MSIVMRWESLRMWMSERPACESFPRMWSRMRTSSIRYAPNSFSENQLDFQSWMIPMRKPPG